MNPWVSNTLGTLVFVQMCNSNLSSMSSPISGPKCWGNSTAHIDNCGHIRPRKHASRFLSSLLARTLGSGAGAGWEALARPLCTGPSPNKETIYHVWAAECMSAPWTTTTVRLYLPSGRDGRPAHHAGMHSHPHTNRCAKHYQRRHMRAALMPLHGRLVPQMWMALGWRSTPTQVLSTHNNPICVSTS